VLELALAAALVLSAGTLENPDYAFVNSRMTDVASGLTKVSVLSQIPTPRYGYFPLVVHVDNTMGPKQTLKLVFTTNGAGGGHTYTRSVELNEHERRAVIVPVPAHLRYGSLRVRGAGITQGGDASVYFNPVNGRQRSVLNIGSAESFQAAVGAAPSYSGSANSQVVSLSFDEAPAELLPYVGWDAVVLTGAKLESLSQAQRAALEQYAALGGQLVLMQGARGAADSFPLLDQDSLHYGLGSVTFCDHCGFPAALDHEMKVPVRAIEPHGRRGKYVYYDDDGTPELSLPVAQTPIGRFLVIIGLFTLAIGPGSLWVARRFGPSMLLLTIPGTAAFTCAFIVGYSALRDGFTVHATVQGFTLLDSRHHRAVTASVGAFYANLAPGGARFEPGVAIIAPTSAREYQNVEQAASMTLDDGIRVGADFIPSRSYEEWSFLAVQPTRARVVLKTDGEKVRVQNALGADAESIELRVGERYFRATNVKDGAEAVAEPVPSRSGVIDSSIDKRLSPEARAVLESSLNDGDFNAVLEGVGFTPLGGLRLSIADSRHVVRGSAER
jgi:hypothetical protein